jgi:uncharacterized iron-regulated membrane protein
VGKYSRRIHRWGGIAAAVPFGIVLVTGILLLVKKQSNWVQPPTRQGVSRRLFIGFDGILAAARAVPEAGVQLWDDIDRLDVRPDKGVVKVRCKNRWEIQVDTKTGDVLQVAYRRSDLIESIHDGSFFHERARVWVFLPSALALAVVWTTGIYLFLVRLLRRGAKRKGRHTPVPGEPQKPETGGTDRRGALA